MRKLSPTEIQFRREHNLCFTCDAKFSLGHKCAAKHYFLIQSAKEVNTELDQHIEDPDSMSIAPEDLSQLTTPLQLSYNALTGLSARGSIHFSRTVQGRDIRILMDEGS